jgi:hypothetical protein
MSDTPKTDLIATYEGNWDTKALRMEDHARQLERELADIREMYDGLLIDHEALVKQRDRLADALTAFRCPPNGCWCDAQMAMHGAHPSHTQECNAAIEALAAVKGCKA